MLSSLLLVLLIGAAAWAGAQAGFYLLLGAVLPYSAVLVFIAGLVRRMIYWAGSPVPFTIPVTGGQEESLGFIRQAKTDCPSGASGVWARMFFEVAFFRSLFRNTSAEIQEDCLLTKGPRSIYSSSKWLWAFALLFHYSILLVFLRHFRFFMEPTPSCIRFLESLDGIMELGSPRFFLSAGLMLAALFFLLGRRFFNERLRYISLPGDYFPLLLLIGIAGTGICLRYFDKADTTAIKVFIMSLTHFAPVSPQGLSPLFFTHLALVCALLLYFPFSKLTHMVGIFFSPTRNAPNNSRRVRRVNPWNPPDQYFTYAEYEDLYREAMAEAGLPLEKQPDGT
ncbi:MAG: sulfate reduction electron transfer complex DsrMKJOP subunit DsrM [Desulfovibrio sp.]|jgi:nitrate reductase gamma subunit|nr:sulfate reduction electron transfer complex DsrMKJOP subunit DsrM [Desulfovibrio sp.]